MVLFVLVVERGSIRKYLSGVSETYAVLSSFSEPSAFRSVGPSPDPTPGSVKNHTVGGATSNGSRECPFLMASALLAGMVKSMGSGWIWFWLSEVSYSPVTVK